MQKKTPTISIIGLGYVGSSLVTLLSKNNVVKCFDINEDKTNKIQNKILGGLFEIAENEGEVGKTNGKIIGEQFHRLKFGDRFFLIIH